MSPPAQLAELERYLRLLYGREPAGGLVEIRFRRPGGAMRQRFHDPGRPRALAATIRWLARRHDVYVGVSPRRRRAGGRDAIERAWALWVDCDSAAAAAALERFAPAPTVTVASGSPGARHAYWLLSEPIAAYHAERLNRRLAAALGADLQACDGARILRPPATLNHKHAPPRPVERTGGTGELHKPGDVAGDLPDPPGAARIERERQSQRDRSADPLLQIEPAVYVEALTGLTPARSGKVSCPFHEDRTPSLHVYRGAHGGWWCFSCERGTSVYDLAAALWGLEPRGDEFLELQRRLYELLLPGTPAPGTPRRERLRG